MTLDLAKIKSDAEKIAANSDLLLMALPVKDVLAMVAEIDQLKADSACLKSHRSDWQAKSLKRGFQYVREPDDHYVLADLPEMAELLGELLGVEVRANDGDSYGEALSVVQEQLDAASNAFLQAHEAEKEREEFRKDAERYRGVRRVANRQGFTDEQFDQQTDTRIASFDAAMAKDRP